MNGKSRKILVALLMAGFAVVQAQADQIEVSGVQTYIGGSNTSVPGSGTADNYSAGTAVNDFAVFDMQKYDGTNYTDYADLKVTYKSDSGSVGSNLMVARTSNSQGLTDGGTISVILTAGAGGGGVTLQFDWYAAGSFVGGVYNGTGSLLNDNVLFTTFDIDYYQYVGAPLNQIDYYAFHTNTLLTADLDSQPGWILAEDNNARSEFTDVLTAAQFMMTGGSIDLQMGKQNANGNALFMFEFRDPSAVLPDFVPEVIPEPTSMMMIGFVGTAAFWVRRRFMS